VHDEVRLDNPIRKTIFTLAEPIDKIYKIKMLANHFSWLNKNIGKMAKRSQFLPFFKIHFFKKCEVCTQRKSSENTGDS